MISLKKTACACLTPILLISSASALVIPLINDGFEGYSSVPAGLPTTSGSVAHGDPAEIVGAYTQGADTVTPRSGSSMVRFVNTYHFAPFALGTNSDLYYLLDLSLYAASLADGLGSISFSAFFNTGASGIHNDSGHANFGEVDNAYFLGLTAYDENFVSPNDIRTSGSSSELAAFNNYGAQLITDRDESTWEESVIGLSLPANTRWVAARFAAHENVRVNGSGEDFISSFADDISLNLDLPNGFVPNAVAVPESGSTLVFFSAAIIGLSLTGLRKKGK